MIFKIEPYWGKSELKEDYCPICYYRAFCSTVVCDKDYNKIGEERICFWAKAVEFKAGTNVWMELDNNGCVKNHAIAFTVNDDMKLQRALMNKHCGKLEVVQKLFT